MHKRNKENSRKSSVKFRDFPTVCCSQLFFPPNSLHSYTTLAVRTVALFNRAFLSEKKTYFFERSAQILGASYFLSHGSQQTRPFFDRHLLTLRELPRRAKSLPPTPGIYKAIFFRFIFTVSEKKYDLACYASIVNTIIPVTRTNVSIPPTATLPSSRKTKCRFSR